MQFSELNFGELTMWVTLYEYLKFDNLVFGIYLELGAWNLGFKKHPHLNLINCFSPFFPTIPAISCPGAIL
jgi:hypothetical protein